jgi:hypothetical protein
VHLDQVHLNITAVPGAGALLAGPAGLLDQVPFVPAAPAPS